MNQLTLDGMVYFEPLLISLKQKWLDEMVAGRKKYEFRRSFFQDQSCAFVYVVAPYSVVSHVVWLDKPIIAPPSEIAKIADRKRPGGGQSVLNYMHGLQMGFAIPIIGIKAIDHILLRDISKRVSSFVPPQLYLRLSRHPQLLRILMLHAKNIVDHHTYECITQ